MIAHRLSTIRNADQVFVLDGGKIIKRCTHVQLIEAQGFYYDLYVSQFRREVDESKDGSPVDVASDAFFVLGD